MRDDQTIERELAVAREDLEARLTELRNVLHDKLQVGKRLREKVERPLRARPFVSVAVALGLGALAALVTTRRGAGTRSALPARVAGARCAGLLARQRRA